MRCTLTASVTGDPAPLHALLSSVEGPGFVDWPDINPRGIVEHTIGLLLRRGSHGGAEKYDHARRIAEQLARRLEDRIERGRRAAETGFVLALDLQKIRPIPRKVLLKGLNGGGREWLIDKWGVDAPIWHVECAVKTEILSEERGRGRPRAGSVQRSWTRTRAVWTFEVEAFPWPCFRVLLKQWPGIEFGVAFDDEFGRFEKTWPVIEVAELKQAA
ncbi:MAG: hypothetical protein ING69_10645 [Rhodocyclaceae bacterium]|nr:hypothetical protein [Rhodocyclaceae bacterium]